jgi:hypothetical protein
MAFTINPAVSGASYRRWSLHAGLFVVGVGLGAMVTYAVARSLYVLLAIAAPASWLAIALPLIALAALRDLGAQVPVPTRRDRYRNGCAECSPRAGRPSATAASLALGS